MNLKIVLAQINRYSDKLRHGRPPSLWRSGDHVLALDAVQVGPSTTSLRAKRSDPSISVLRNELLRFARNDGWRQFRDLAAHFARGLHLHVPPYNPRAQGRPGARCTRGLACQLRKQKCTRAYRFSGNTPAFPAQWLYGLLRALPSERLFCHCRRARREPLRNLTPAPRRQDHTTSPYASCALVFCAIRVHRIPPRVRDDREPPLVTGETRGITSLICPTARAEYFSLKGWTGFC